MSDIAEIAPKLRDLNLFAEFTENEMEAFIELVETMNFSDGDIVVEQDGPGDAMFVITEGSVRVVHRAVEQEIELAHLSAGNFFGELALVDELPRSANVIAIGPVQMISISQGTIRALAGVYPSASFKLLIAVGRVLVARLRAGNKKYIDSLLG